MGEEREVKIGNLYGFDGGNYAGNVYDLDALSPAIRTYQGGNQQPLVVDVSGTIRASYYKNSERNVMENLKSGKGYEGVIVAMRGRNPENPSDRTAGIPTEQRLEVNEQGICNCLTSVQKDNLVMETLYDFYNEKVREDSLCGTITANGNISSTHCGTFGVIQVNQATRKGYAECETGGLCRIESGEDSYTLAYEDGEYIYYIRIRKLIPLECWRLMGFSDKDFLKAEEVNSNTQLYKQAGNSIVKNVLVAIIGQMFEGCEDMYKKC
ncbi:MAG: DNA cytosine methyltransferase [bacterium]|nr:DNA cytosine methyltransferase [bacterium]MCM1542648.1 DNA cytosine methyltransferase [Blautia sp.]